MENEKTPPSIIYQLLELAAGAQCRADLAQLQVSDIVHTAVNCGATWDQVGKWLNLTPDAAAQQFAEADGSITLDEDVVISLGYLAKVKRLPTLSAAIGYVLANDSLVADLLTQKDDACPVSATEG